jgi:hypothetical protein
MTRTEDLEDITLAEGIISAIIVMIFIVCIGRIVFGAVKLLCSYLW